MKTLLSLLLVALEVLVQPAASEKVAAGGNVLVRLLQRSLSPGVAGVPNRRGTAPEDGSSANASTAVAPQVTTGVRSMLDVIKANSDAPVNVGGGPNKAK
jgi:hypothetical protein